ncbi:MAG: AMP-binding protein [Clostridia bacterium]|nr:AMP-binding protein [Clostridia bacterium]
MKKPIHEKKEYLTFREAVEDMGQLYSDRVAYSFRIKPSDKEIRKKTYTELRDDVRALATEFITRGVPGKQVALVGRLSYHWIVTYYATLCCGGVLVPLDKEWLAQDLADTGAKAEVSFVICDGDIIDKGRAIAEAAGAAEPIALEYGEGTVDELIELGRVKFNEDRNIYFGAKIDVNRMSLLVFTSGTTGKGKGVMLSQKNLLSDMASPLQYIDFTFKSVGVLPPHHTFGSTVNIFGHNCIGCEIYISSGIRYVQKELKEQKPGHMVLVPLYLETFYRKIMANIKEQGKEKLIARMIKISNFLRKIGIDLRRKLFKQVLAAFGGEIRMVVCGGAPINQDILTFFDGVGIEILNGYGITECAPIIACNHAHDVIPGSVGPAADVNEVIIHDPNEDGEGEIWAKGPNVMLGYFKDEEATREAITEDGYFRTGDYGKLGKKGEIYITGRKKNLIILSNGKNVYPEEIESEFISVPGVIDIIVYEGQSKRGSMYNTIVAEVYPDEDYIKKNNVEDIYAHLKKYVDEYNLRAVSYKKIGILKVRTEEFPKNTLRKIMRFKLDMTID